MKKAACLIVLSAFAVMAANIWQKPYTDWSDKDVTKILSESPWVKSTSITMSFPGSNAAPPPMGGGGGGGGRGGAPQGGSEGFGGAPSVEILARLESALPIRQALVRRNKPADAEKILSEEPKSYEVVLSGSLGMFVMGPPDQVSQRLKDVTMLSSAKSGMIKPSLIQVGQPGRTMDVLFVFPRMTQFTLEDQEVEFTTKLGTSNLKYKFKLKDMVVNGKLEM